MLRSKQEHKSKCVYVYVPGPSFSSAASSSSMWAAMSKFAVTSRQQQQQNKREKDRRKSGGYQERSKQREQGDGLIPDEAKRSLSLSLSLSLSGITLLCSALSPLFFSFSVKVEGERLYEKARRGEKIDVPARKITIYDFQIERNKEDRSNLITTYHTSDIYGILLCLL